jgi:uncharacterized protein (TIGR04168 family)
VRLAAIGDVHLRFGAEDVESLDGAGYDAVLFVGDLAGYRAGGGVEVAHRIAPLRTPAIAIPGNHDAVYFPQLVAEMLGQNALSAILGVGQEARVEALRRALAPVRLVGYEVCELRSADRVIDCVVGRPHSFGGPRMAFRRYLSAAFGVGSMEESAAKLCGLVDRAASETIVFLAHNGPSGLGARRSDIWGRDFDRREGDFGDPDLRAAIEHAKKTGRRVAAVIAGHMHHHLRGGGHRTWTVEEGETLYVNAARVPRVFRKDGRVVRHRVEIAIEGGRARALEILD